MPPILLIGGCHKYLDFLTAAIRRAQQSTTWEVIGVIGDETKPISFDESTRILCVPVSDVYEALPAKLHAAYCWIRENRPGIPGVFKTDDDILWDIHRLAEAITTNQVLPYWGVRCARCVAGPVNPRRIEHRFADTSLRPSHPAATYCYGWGYWLSATEALPAVCAAASFADAPLEDVCTGAVLNAIGLCPYQVAVPFREVPRSPELLLVS